MLCECNAAGNPLHDEASKRGVHHACWKAGPDAACRDCFDIIMEIMAELYDDVSPDRLRTVIHTDITEGRL
jgi:hypothetical protein